MNVFISLALYSELNHTGDGSDVKYVSCFSFLFVLSVARNEPVQLKMRSSASLLCLFMRSLSLGSVMRAEL